MEGHLAGGEGRSRVGDRPLHRLVRPRVADTGGDDHRHPSGVDRDGGDGHGRRDVRDGCSDRAARDGGKFFFFFLRSSVKIHGTVGIPSEARLSRCRKSTCICSVLRAFILLFFFSFFFFLFFLPLVVVFRLVRFARLGRLWCSSCAHWKITVGLPSHSALRLALYPMGPVALGVQSSPAKAIRCLLRHIYKSEVMRSGPVRSTC